MDPDAIELLVGLTINLLTNGISAGFLKTAVASLGEKDKFYRCFC
jgi:hypothetical protein